MRLPGRNDLTVPRRKVTGYLLAAGHPVGGPKARYFLSRGFSLDRPEQLEGLLEQVGREGEVVEREATKWGIKYVVEGSSTAPDGNPIRLRVVWIVREQESPELVTAYPA